MNPTTRISRASLVRAAWFGVVPVVAACVVLYALFGYRGPDSYRSQMAIIAVCYDLPLWIAIAHTKARVGSAPIAILAAVSVLAFAVCAYVSPKIGVMVTWTLLYTVPLAAAIATYGSWGRVPRLVFRVMCLGTMVLLAEVCIQLFSTHTLVTHGIELLLWPQCIAVATSAVYLAQAVLPEGQASETIYYVPRTFDSELRNTARLGATLFLAAVLGLTPLNLMMLPRFHGGEVFLLIASTILFAQCLVLAWIVWMFACAIIPIRRWARVLAYVLTGFLFFGAFPLAHSIQDRLMYPVFLENPRRLRVFSPLSLFIVQFGDSYKIRPQRPHLWYGVSFAVIAAIGIALVLSAVIVRLLRQRTRRASPSVATAHKVQPAQVQEHR